uniref:Uncharacterized protein n=1 Tax=Romanomermis culicivorax TaxID=13658 RepID=A0A915K977_ROMCU
MRDPMWRVFTTSRSWRGKSLAEIKSMRRLISLFVILIKLLLKAQVPKKYSTAGEIIANANELEKYLYPADRKIRNV